jgi:hypothetical protein
MKLRFSSILPVAVAVIVGIVTLAGYFITYQAAQNLQTGILFTLASLENAILRGAIFLSCIALLIGVINLSRVHLRKTLTGRTGGAYSLVLLFTLWITFAIVLYTEFYYGPQNLATAWIVRYIQVPLEASLSALIVFVLLVGGARLLFRRRNLASFLFLASALLVLLAAVPLPNLPSSVLGPVDSARGLAVSALMVLAGGGGRGILLGMALGAAATGLRVLMGIDRPYER